MSERTWVLDLETYYKSFKDDTERYSMKTMKTTEYVKDARWLVHGLAVLDPSGEASFRPECEIPAVLAEIKPDDVVVGHNWAFDGLALAYHYSFNHWRVIDTLLLANAVLGPATDRGQGNALGELAEELGLEAKGRLDPLDGVRDLSPDQWNYLALYAKGDARLTKQILALLLPRLSRPGLELWLLRHNLNIFINRPIQVSTPRLHAAIEDCQAWKRATLDKVMKPGTKPSFANAGLETVGTMPLITEEKQLSSQKQFTEILTPILTKHRMSMPMKKSNPRKDGSTEMIPALAKTDEGLKALMACGIKSVEELITARLVKKSSATIMSRLKGLVGSDIAHMSQVYHGTCTGRNSGGGNGWNPLNIPAPHRATSEEEAVMARAIRSCLIPKAGHVFVSTDASQIEARILAWASGQQNVADAFGRGDDLYSDFIGDVLGETIVKGASTYDDALRSVGKEAILGLGFNMGWFKFLRRLREHPQSAAIREALGHKLGAPLVKQLVDTYREQNPYITQFWDDMEDGFHVARKGGEQQVGPMLFSKAENKQALYMTYPCGRRVRYSKIRTTPGKHGGDQWIYGRGKKIYGGLVTENGIQGTARDVLVEGVWSMEKMGYPVVLSVYDSVVCQVPENRADQCLADCIGTLSQPPTWGPDLQLDAEGHIAEDFN